jgi:DNA-binding response OmpR family regulator
MDAAVRSERLAFWLPSVSTMRLHDVSHTRALVLVLSADARLQRLVAHAVEKEHFAPVVATSLADGYGVLATHYDSIAFVVLDVMDEELDVFSFRRPQLDAPRTAAIPIVTLSARPLSADERTYLHPFASLAVPFRLHEIRELAAVCSQTMMVPA